MPELSETIRIAAPPDQVWPLLSDPALVASCIPGATLTEAGADGVHRGEIRVKFGPTVATFRGEATLTYDHQARRVTIEGRGIDQRGASRALASGTVAASGTDSTVLAVTGEFNVTGPLETFANAGGVHVARALLAEFAGNMAKLVADRSPQPAPAPEPAPDVGAGLGRPEVPSASSGRESGPAEAGPYRSPPPQHSRPAAELSGGSLLWRAFLSWLKSLFGARRV